ncbi:MAG: hypothetical protein QXD19_05725, partial [Candidatus Bathyarchaeia archaeon]
MEGKSTKKKQDPKTVDTIDQPQAPAVISGAPKKPAVFQEVHALQEPYVYAAIVREKDTQKLRYEVIEPTLQPSEEKHLREIKSFLMDEIDVNLKEIENREKAENYLRQKIREIIKKYRMKIS